MISSIALYVGKALERGISRLYLLLENGVYLELENGAHLETEAK
jgi:hypothetical protein